jgi:hypothetical protein
LLRAVDDFIGGSDVAKDKRLARVARKIAGVLLAGTFSPGGSLGFQARARQNSIKKARRFSFKLSN